MRVEHQPAFVLHARAWRETSMLVEVLTRDHGRVGVVARGVRGPRSRQPRALLQPLVPLSLGWIGRGELATLSGIESTGPALSATGEGLLCALYVNEVIIRLVQRHDPHADVFADYVETLARLARGEHPAWTLRRFERDLLAHLGYAIIADCEAESDAPLDPGRDYGYRFEFGAVPWRSVDDGLKLRGTALLALAEDRQPGSEDLAALRRLMRALISRHLDGKDLRAWGLFGASAAPTR